MTASFLECIIMDQYFIYTKYYNNYLNYMNKIKKHPTLAYADDLKNLCRPLEMLKISYFGYSRVVTLPANTGPSSC